MQKIGIICEYNPFHLGHKKQFQLIREHFGTDCGIVCLMSGHFVQRGEPAIYDPMVRSKAAVLAGADLVLELPPAVSLSSAEGFAAGGVRILSGFCNALCFGTETLTTQSLINLAESLLSPAFSTILKEELARGISFPSARQSALERMGIAAASLQNPNDILAVEYTKAILEQGCSMQPFPIRRDGSYHASTPDADNPSATSLRNQIHNQQAWLNFIPQETRSCYCDAAPHELQYGERAILGKLRTMSDVEFESLPFGSEGLWRKFMHACRSQSTLEEILKATKSKRYTSTRLNRMVMCAFLGITDADMCTPAPYVRVLAFNDHGRNILKEARNATNILNAGEPAPLPYWDFEKRVSDLYDLFSSNGIPLPGAAQNRRVVYVRRESP